MTLPLYACEKEVPLSRRLIRKLAIVHDIEGKSRVIAMADYWSQSATLPLHKLMLSLLEKISSDLTYGQDIGPFGDKSEPYFSYDLTAATDRIPVQCYTAILSSWFGTGYAEAWRLIMVKYPFRFESKEY
jgi:hypothetical protein